MQINPVMPFTAFTARLIFPGMLTLCAVNWADTVNPDYHLPHSILSTVLLVIGVTLLFILEPFSGSGLLATKNVAQRREEEW